MIVGTVLREAEAAVCHETIPDVGEQFYAVLHDCVDGSHQWCREHETPPRASRIEAVMDAYKILLDDLAYDRATTAHLEQLAEEGAL